ncbi:hypothetical protein QJQ45_024598 [Haematococcus lacustris]|nr:hypothetical protein QJQ45_024598 [Haematococcus lacustris]
MGVSDEDRTKLDETLKELKLSNEECDKFSKAFKDPEFIKLFEEYAKEVSDPKVKDETDLYLRQLESEGRAEEVYGKGTVLVVPKEGYVIRTLEQPSGRKVYINVCTSDKVDKMRMEPRPGPDGKVGRHVELPLTLSSKKSGVDKQGNPCWVWDFVVHPDVLVVAAQTPAISKLVAETAMEQIQDAHGVVCSRQYKQLGMKYKGADGAPAPHVLGVKASNAPCTSTSPGSGAAPSSRLKPMANNSSLPPTPAAAAGAAGGGSAGSAVGSEPSKDVEGQRGAGKVSRSAFTFGKGKASKAAAQDPSSTQVRPAAEERWQGLVGEV